MKTAYVYILATKMNRIQRLVYFEVHDDVREAIIRERQIKRWKRAWKIRLIEKKNPYWFDLYYEITGEDGPLPAQG